MGHAAMIEGMIKKYEAYLTAKLRILTELFSSDKNEIPKGIVHLIEVEL